MAKRPKKTKKSQAKVEELVIAAYAEDWEQAKDYETLLKNNDIPATIKEQDEQSTGVKSIAVMVPEDSIDEAHIIIESQNAYDDFYDFAVEDKDNDEFDSDVFENDF